MKAFLNDFLTYLIIPSKLVAGPLIIPKFLSAFIIYPRIPLSGEVYVRMFDNYSDFTELSLSKSFIILFAVI